VILAVWRNLSKLARDDAGCCCMHAVTSGKTQSKDCNYKDRKQHFGPIHARLGKMIKSEK
jgi:hypothetical protein